MLKRVQVVRAGAALVVALSTLGGCRSVPSAGHLTADAPNAQLFDGLGSHTRAITTDSPEAQAYFNQGLNWMYAFNHDEAIRSFAKAAELDPAAAMPWLGIALCEGPNYNDPVMTEERNAAAYGASKEALARLAGATPIERTLIRAAATRYAWPAPSDRSGLEEAYADAMAAAWAANPTDSDIGTLYAESMMVKRPWRLYSVAMEAEGETDHIVETLEAVMAMDPGNPGASHLYIHAVEPSTTPERGIAAANRLATQMPGAGHMDHMPSHIYVRVGMWDESIDANRLAMEADGRYLEAVSEPGLQVMYQVHNAHMLAYAAMMVGREQEAMNAARAMWDLAPLPMLEAAAQYIDLWMTSVYDVQKRFGRWDAILAEPAPPEFLPITTAVWRSHRAIGLAAKKDIAGAQREYGLFRDATDAIPEGSVFGEDPAHRILSVSDLFVRGEIALQQERWGEAIGLLQEAAVIEDRLGYSEPPQWLQPVRHTLGAVYLASGDPVGAERTYRADLAKWPSNGWSLLGLSGALAAQGRDAESAVAFAEHRRSWAKADAKTTTSCACLPDP